jgi:23S rRNA pseudouridine2605 synthase
MQERLQKVISHAGIVSRREAERLITEGRVAVNGCIVTQLGTKVEPTRDKINVDGRLVKSFPGKVYVLMNKPAGYVSTLKDPQERPVVTDLLDRINTRVFPVGRLDYDAEGVLLLTNDGELAHRLQHPRYGISRTYEVKVKDVPANSELSSLRKGVRLEDGITLPAKAKFLKKTTINCWLKITLYEGKNRQVKRMCAAIGHPVLKIKRVSLGPLSLGDVSRGKYRHLTQDEVKELYALVSLKL